MSADQATPATPTTTTAPKAVTPEALQRRVTAERIAYGAATLGITIGPQLDAGPLSTLASLGVAAGTGAWLYSKTKDHHDGYTLLHACQRGLPVLTGAGLYAASVLTPGTSWWEIAAPAAWGALMGLLAPITRSAHLAVAAPQQQTPPTPALGLNPAPTPQPTTYNGYLAHLWQSAVVAPGTQLTAITQYRPDRPDFEAVIVAERGKAVPRLTETALAAAFDFPAGTVTIKPIPHSGPGRMLLTARPTLTDNTAQADGLEAMWETTVSKQGGAAPGMELVKHRIEEDRIILQVAAPAGKTIRLPHAALCSALGIDDPSRVVIETDGVRQGIINVYRTNPLMNVRKATVEDLTMDDKGRISIGVRHDGKPSRIRLWDPDQGALRGITAGATGAGKSVFQLLLLAAEKRSGVVSWVADLQGGKSLPEAEGNVDWFAKGEAETMALLLATHAVMKYREHQSRNRADFALGKPWPLLNVTLDEINRLLSSPDEETKKAAAHLIADIQKTGRKVGVGIRLAVQSLHLKDLGDEEAIRQQGKAGMVVLMRTLSSSTQGMGLDGIAPPGFMMENIPARIYENGQVEALFNGDDDEDGQSTAGMAYVFVDGRAEFMRTFYAQKVDGRYVDILELFGTEPPVTLTPEEIAVAGAAYANRTNREALASIAQNLPATATAADSNEPGAGPALPFTPPTTKTTLKDRILELLADGPMAIKAIRAALPDVAPGSVNNTIGQLHDVGLVIPVSRGTYKLADTQPSQNNDNAMEDELNELLPMAIELVISTQLGSASMLQRKLRIGWDLANTLMQTLELAGIVGPQDGDKNRPVLVNAEDLEAAIATARQPQ